MVVDAGTDCARMSWREREKTRGGVRTYAADMNDATEDDKSVSRAVGVILPPESLSQSQINTGRRRG